MTPDQIKQMDVEYRKLAEKLAEYEKAEKESKNNADDDGVGKSRQSDKENSDDWLENSPAFSRFDKYYLKPCPFCGKKPVFHTRNVEVGGGQARFTFSIECPNCHIEQGTYYIDVYLGSDGKFAAYHKCGLDGAVEIWNRRHE